MRDGLILPGKTRWHALLVYPQREDATKAWLAQHGVESFFPVTEAFKHNPRALKPKTRYWRKYLPGYVFARFPGEPVWHCILSEPRGWGPRFARDVLRVTSGEPGVLHEETLASLQAMSHVDHELQEQRRTARTIRKGDRARFRLGDSAEWEEVVVEIDASGRRAKFALRLLGKQEAWVDIDRLEKVA